MRNRNESHEKMKNNIFTLIKNIYYIISILSFESLSIVSMRSTRWTRFPHFYCLHKEGQLLCEFVEYVTQSKITDIQENMKILISFVERGLVFTKYYNFPTTIFTFFRTYFTKVENKMTLFQYLLFHHPSDTFIEYLLSNPLFSLDPSSSTLVHACPVPPQSLLLVYLENNMKHISYSMFKNNESSLLQRLELLLTHLDFHHSHLFLHQFAFIFILQHEFGNEKLMELFLKSGMFNHLSFFPHFKKFKTSMSILLLSRKKKRNEKLRMCRLLLQYGGHFEIRTLEKIMENHRKEVENSLDFFSHEKQEEYWDEIYECLTLIRKENQRFETFIEFYFPSAQCPLTLNVLYYPLLLSDGQSYEKTDFEIWKTICYENYEKYGNYENYNHSSSIISPTTNLPLKHQKIEMNIYLFDLIIHIRRVYTTLSLYPNQNEKIHDIFSKDRYLHPSSLSSLDSLCSLCSNHSNISNIAFNDVWEEYLRFKSQYAS